MNKKIVESFLLERKGYLKKSPAETLAAIFKLYPQKFTADKVKLNSFVELIAEVQSDMRRAKTLATDKREEQAKFIYKEIAKLKDKEKKILLLDIEVSPNIVSSWRIGSKVFLSPDNIIKERAVICVAYKWYGEKKTYSIQWDNGDDKVLLEKFSKVIEQADIVLHQNGDAFDIPWLRTRCIFHNVPFPAKINSIDTLKYARFGFYFNSNKLDYLGKFLKVGQKIETPSNLWTKVAIDNDKQALKEMVEYCKGDIKLLEDVYNKLKPYIKEKKFKFLI